MTAAFQIAAIYTATICAICAVLYIVKAGDRRRADEAHHQAEERRYRFEQLGQAVERLDLDPGVRYWTYDEFFDAIYTAAHVERQP